MSKINQTEKEEKDLKALEHFINNPFVILYNHPEYDTMRFYSSCETMEKAKKDCDYLIREKNLNAYIFELKEIVRRSFELESIFVKEKKENEQQKVSKEVITEEEKEMYKKTYH